MLAFTRLQPHLMQSLNFADFQCGFRPKHSTHTALVRVANDIRSAADTKQAIMSISLDISSAFDTIDHNKLLHRLQTEFDVTGLTLP
jgi:retron-type reverse transcriptase